MEINLATTPWVPVGREKYLSLEDLFRSELNQVLDIPYPITEACIIRLLLWINYQSNGDLLGWLEVNQAKLDLLNGRFLQDEDAAAANNAREPWMILNQQDASNAALMVSQSFRLQSQSAAISLALLTASMADRGGLKASLPGVERSGIACPMAGNYVVFRYGGETISDVIAANEQFVDDEVADLLLWKWRRLFIQPSGAIVVASAGNHRPTAVDPFIGTKARFKAPSQEEIDPGSVVWEDSVGQPCRIYALSTMQAMPQSHYKRVFISQPPPTKKAKAKAKTSAQ